MFICFRSLVHVFAIAGRVGRRIVEAEVQAAVLVH